MKRLAIFLAALFAAATLARAETPPVCGGKDLMAELKAESPAGYERVMAAAKAKRNSEAILWRVEKQGVAPSYLFGTAHVTDPRVVTLPAAVEQAFAGASTVALELKEVRDTQELAMASLRQARYMVLPPGQTLWDLIPDDQESLIRDNPNLPPDANKTMFGLQPWVVAVSMSLPACELQRRSAGLAALDEVLARRAEAQGAELVGLETVEEQFRALSSLSLDKQVDYLLAAAKLSPKAADYMETLVVLYQQRQVSALEPLAQELEGFDSDLQAIMAGMEQSLLLRRNHVMAARAAPLIDRGKAFIAVGAMHLPGDEGVVELLRKAGYKVTPVN